MTMFVEENVLLSRARAQAILDDWNKKALRRWSRSRRFGLRFHNPSLWAKRVVQTKQWFSVFNGPNHSGVGAQNFRCLELQTDPEPW